MCSASATSSLRVRVAQQVGQLGQFAVGFRQLVPARGVHQPDAGLDAALEAVAAAEVIGVVAPTDSRRLPARRARRACRACESTRRSPPCLSCSICTRNSMSTVPPGPRLRLRCEAVSSSRSRIWRISVANSGCHGGPNAASATTCIACSAAAAAPSTTRALQSACRSQSWPRPSAEVAGEGVERHGQRAARAGRPQPGVDFVQPAVRAEVAGIMRIIRWPNSLKKWLLVVPPVRARVPAERVCRRLRTGRSGRDRCDSSARGRRACPERKHDRLASVALAVGEALPLLRGRSVVAVPDSLGPRIVGSPNFSTSFDVLARGDLLAGTPRRCRPARRASSGCRPCPACRARRRAGAGRS